MVRDRKEYHKKYYSKIIEKNKERKGFDSNIVKIFKR